MTEDMDLSYRAQLAGLALRVRSRAFAFRQSSPPSMNSFKSQQYRWAKGSVQTARKLLATTILLAARVPGRREARGLLSPHEQPRLLCSCSCSRCCSCPTCSFGGSMEDPTLLLLDVPLVLGDLRLGRRVLSRRGASSATSVGRVT